MVSVPLGPAQLDITGVRAGDQNQIQLTLIRGGAPVVLTDLTFTASARVTQTDTESLDAVVEIVDEDAGLITLRWPGEDVRTWLDGQITASGVWDLQMANGTADPVTVVAGTFTAEMDVTR